jgi:hypothetical protein
MGEVDGNFFLLVPNVPPRSNDLRNDQNVATVVINPGGSCDVRLSINDEFDFIQQLNPSMPERARRL